MNNLQPILDLIEVTNCQFVSFKYFAKDGQMQQFDVPAKLIQKQEEYITKEFDINLEQIRAFVDPFRSMPTISVFCYKKAVDNSGLLRLEKIANSNKNCNNFQASISFWVENNELEQNDFVSMQADPYDLYANLRSEISSIADEIKINISSHHYGHSYGESVINISAENIFQLAEDILVMRFIISNCAASYNFQSSFVAFNHSHNLRVMCNHISSNKLLKCEGLIHNQIELYQLLMSFISTWS